MCTNLVFQAKNTIYIFNLKRSFSTYGHRSQRTEDPVRSPELKLRTGRLVLRWVTTGEYRLLYVLPFRYLMSSELATFCLGVHTIEAQYLP